MAKEIPNDVAFTILSKLPLKSLHRFTSVHKSWAQLLENPFFINMLAKKCLSEHDSTYKSLIVQTKDRINDYRCALYFLSGDKFENQPVKLDWPRSLQVSDRRDIEICSSAIHGTFCLYNTRRKKIFLWNPTTGEFRVIPRSPLDIECSLRPDLFGTIDPIGFGYDPIRDDFKVIRKLECGGRFEDGRPVIPYPCWEIYSLRSNSWRKLDIPTDYVIYGMGCCDMNGMCHWFAKVNKYDGEKLLASFNLSNEVFITTPLPSSVGGRTGLEILMPINGSVGVCVMSLKDGEATFHISILGEIGAKGSWTKLFIVGPLPNNPYPIGVGKKGIFFRKHNGELALFDLSTQMLEEVAFKWKIGYGQLIVYKENILPFIDFIF